MGFINKPQYSACSEDTDSEVTSLNIESEGVVIAIAGGRGRALGLLSKPCQQLIAIDFNRHQAAITALKAAAIRSLNYQDFIHFLGVYPRTKINASARNAVFDSLDEPWRSYWRKRKSFFSKSFLYRGELERRFSFGAKVMAVTLGGKFTRLVDAKNLTEQIDATNQLIKIRLFRERSASGRALSFFVCSTIIGAFTKALILNLTLPII